MELNFECIVKTAKDTTGNILWRAIYVNNKKETENYNIDLDKALKYYAPKGCWKEVIFTEDDVYSFLEDHFPEIENFTFLLDYSEIEIGKKVFLSDKISKVNKTWSDYRPSGEYEIWHWEEIDNKYYAAKSKQFFQGHNVIKFTVDNSDVEYVWEDWNYQQSFLYLNYIQHGKRTDLVE